MKITEVRRIIEEAAEEERNLLEPEAYQILENYGISVPEYDIASAKEEALEQSARIGFPVVLKVVSPLIGHKSDAGGVVLDLSSDNEVEEAFQELETRVGAKKPGSDVRGILVAKMMPPGTEVIVGMTRDPQFGPTILFGLGGIFVEVLKDVSYRVAPVSEKEAERMIRDIKGYPLLKGARKTEPVDLKALTDLIVKISRLSIEIPEIEELDLNPVLAYGKGVYAVDARIVLNTS
jgi:acetyl-CoA synthetase (ADP-forming)